MGFLIVFPYYFAWHYGRALTDFIEIWKDFLVFIYNFFSIKTLLFSLFSPWKRMGDQYLEHQSLEDIAGTFVVNFMMRCVGAVARLFLIIFGVLCLLVALCLGTLMFAVWLGLPAIMVFLVTLSFGWLSK